MPESVDTTVSLKRNADEVLRMPPSKMMLPLKPLDMSSRSLASLMTSRRSSLQSMHKKFAFELSQQQRRRVSFGEDPLPTPSSEPSSSEPCEPPLKRRRFQRRNSKTAAMLLTSMSSIIASEFEKDEEQESGTTGEPPKTISTTHEDNPWDGGLEIAEELVRHLKLRRQANAAAASS